MSAAPHDFARVRHGVALARLRGQAALVRALVDELERIAPTDDADERLLCEQIVEELARFGCRVLETAAALANGVEIAGRSMGVA